jgi:hypothetical protein
MKFNVGDLVTCADYPGVLFEIIDESDDIDNVVHCRKWILKPVFEMFCQRHHGMIVRPFHNLLEKVTILDLGTAYHELVEFLIRYSQGNQSLTNGSSINTGSPSDVGGTGPTASSASSGASK